MIICMNYLHSFNFTILIYSIHYVFEHEKLTPIPYHPAISRRSLLRPRTINKTVSITRGHQHRSSPISPKHHRRSSLASVPRPAHALSIGQCSRRACGETHPCVLVCGCGGVFERGRVTPELEVCAEDEGEIGCGST